MSHSRLCWSCRGQVTTELDFCSTCRVIQPPDPGKNFFALFGIPPQFDIDIHALEASHRQLQQLFHPDLFVARSGSERRYSMEHVTRLNDGYRTLKAPFSRAEYILKLSGIKTGQRESETTVDPEFLLEIMEQRESLDSLDPKAKDAGDRLRALRADVGKRIQEEIAVLSKLFADYFQSKNPHYLEESSRYVGRWRYYNRFLEALDRKDEAMYGDY